jgi:hypothetical protein
MPERFSIPSCTAVSYAARRCSYRWFNDFLKLLRINKTKTPVMISNIDDIKTIVESISEALTMPVSM